MQALCELLAGILDVLLGSTEVPLPHAFRLHRQVQDALCIRQLLEATFTRGVRLAEVGLKLCLGLLLRYGDVSEALRHPLQLEAVRHAVFKTLPMAPPRGWAPRRLQ